MRTVDARAGAECATIAIAATIIHNQTPNPLFSGPRGKGNNREKRRNRSRIFINLWFWSRRRLDFARSAVTSQLLWQLFLSLKAVVVVTIINLEQSPEIVGGPHEHRTSGRFLRSGTAPGVTRTGEAACVERLPCAV